MSRSFGRFLCRADLLALRWFYNPLASIRTDNLTNTYTVQLLIIPSTLLIPLLDPSPTTRLLRLSALLLRDEF